MSELINMINETLNVIRSKTKKEYPIGIILGTGLGGLVKEIEIEHQLDYAELPHFPLSTVESHHGSCYAGEISLLRRIYNETNYISCSSNEKTWRKYSPRF